MINGFSKKVENPAHAVSLHYMHYNFARPHQSLTITDENGRTIKHNPCDGGRGGSRCEAIATRQPDPAV